jgi:hypothetical protein
MPFVKRSPHVLLVAALSCLLISQAGAIAGQGPDQVAESTTIVGSVTLHGGFDPIADVEVSVFGPMEGQAKAAIASFPLMAAEISETLRIPHVTTTTGTDGRFSFQHLAPGLYSVLATRKGYVGPARPGDPPTSVLVTATITVAAKERAEVLLSMVPGEYKPQLPFGQRPQ